MESESYGIPVESKKSVLTTVTPLSKYLAMALFVMLPFVGGWVGYQYAPVKIVEVVKEVDIEVQEDVKSLEQSLVVESEDEFSVKVPTLTRQELITKDNELANKWSLESNVHLFWLKNNDTEDEMFMYERNGLSVLLPYNEGWGSPFYRLTKYDEVGDATQYYTPAPCPFGCNFDGNDKAVIYNSIVFHDKSNISFEDAISHYQENVLCDDCAVECKEDVNEYLVSGITCNQQWNHGGSVTFYDGTNYFYEFRNMHRDAKVLSVR